MDRTVEKEFQEALEKCRDVAGELRRKSRRTEDHEDALLLYDGAKSIELMLNLVKTYDRNINTCLKHMLNMKHDAEHYAYLWTIAQSVLDKDSVDAILLLTREREEKHDTAGISE